MARPEVTGRKLSSGADERDAYSVDEFCARHGISSQMFYKFPEQMPPSFTVGTRRLIGREAAAAWRRERERAAKTALAPRRSTVAPSREADH